MNPSSRRLAGLLHSLAALLLGFSLGSAPALAQPAYPVADLGSGVLYHANEFLLPREYANANGLLFFFQDDGIHGRELWRSDGTALGTFMLRDLCPGSCGSRFTASGVIAAVGTEVFFSANDGTHGLELWRTDGTALGTEMVLDLVPGWASSFPYLLTAASNQLFFTAQGVDGTSALWRSDGTPAGTYPIPNPPGYTQFRPESISVGPGFLYLCTPVGSLGPGLWRTDGSAQGTLPVAEPACVDFPYLRGTPRILLPSGVLLYAAGDATTGIELWRSDGTPAGTHLVKDLLPGTEGSSPYGFASGPDGVYFLARNALSQMELWVTDGTGPGTSVVALPGGATIPFNLAELIGIDERLFFGASDGVAGAEPWVLDQFGAHRILDLNPGVAPSLPQDFYNQGAWIFARCGDSICFVADDGLEGMELWRSDGTGAGTERISDFGPGSDGITLTYALRSRSYGYFGETLSFFEQAVGESYRLWKIDDTFLEPVLVDVIDNQASEFYPEARDRGSLFEYSLGHLCFAAGADHLYMDLNASGLYFDLWASDGSAAGTRPRLDGIETQTSIAACNAIGDRLLYYETDSLGQNLFSLDVTPLAPELIRGGGGGGTLPPLLPWSDRLAVLTNSGLIATDGTGPGTEQLADGDDGAWFQSWVGRLLYSNESLWLVDPALGYGAVNLTSLTDITDVDEIAVAGSYTVFIATTPSEGAEIWGSDGTEETAEILADIFPGPRGGLERGPGFDGLIEAREPLLVGGGSFAAFSADDGVYGRELWVTDGTFLGTGLLKDVYPGEYPSTPRHLTRLGNQVLFTAEDEEHGLELWTTDGTYEGTHLLKDLAPGAASSVPDDLVVRGGTLYFSAWTPAYGREAWKSDGTSAGTLRITDIAPGSLSSSPQRFVRTSNRLYFTATDQVHGYELWAISDDGLTPLFLDGFESEDTTRWSATSP